MNDTNGVDPNSFDEPHERGPRSAPTAVQAPAPVGNFICSGDLAPLFAALAKAQGSFGQITRSQTATIKMREGGSYEFSYAPLDEVLTAVRSALAANGLWLGQPIYSTGNGKYTLRTILAHASGASMAMLIELPASSDIKALGSAITYLRRYTVQALLGLAAEEDDDGSAARGDGYEPQARRQAPARTAVTATTNGSAKPEPPQAGATEQDLETMLEAMGRSPSVPDLDALTKASKGRPWSTTQKQALNRAYTKRKAELTNPANDASEVA